MEKKTKERYIMDMVSHLSLLQNSVSFAEAYAISRLKTVKCASSTVEIAKTEVFQFLQFVRLIQKQIFSLVLFSLIPGVLFSLPPLRTENPDAARAQLIRDAEKYQGVPYRYGGMSRSGMDCSGLVYLAFQDALKVSVPRTVETLYAWIEKIKTTDLQIGDLVFFNTTGRISHVGIYAGNNRFIHSASDGPQTGVMISSLDESYWKRTYVGAGRALSESSGANVKVPALASSEENQHSTNDDTAKAPRQTNARLLFSLGAAVSWNNYIHENDVLRGAGFHIGAALPLSIAGKDFSIGLELRPAWDFQLDVFRLPITLSFGGDMLRVFLGPALSFGDPALNVPEGKRSFDGGTNWIGEGGITFAPFTLNVKDGKFAFYGELAWQFYFPESGQQKNWMADLSAATRISTGVRYIFGK